MEVVDEKTRWQAIAYEHRFVPEVGSDRDVDLSIAWGRGKPDAQDAEYKVGVHPIPLGGPPAIDELPVFSGTSGVTHPILGQDSRRQEDVLERALASQMNLIISRTVYDEPGAVHGFLVQGPLLRKLLGRLAYRYYDPERVLVLAIDGDERRLRVSCPESGSWQKLNVSEGLFACFGPDPVLSLDATVRRYEIVFEDQCRLIVQVPCCALPTSRMRNFYHDLVPSRIREVLRSVSENASAGPLLLARAYKKACRELEDSRATNADIGWVISKSNDVKLLLVGTNGPASGFINQISSNLGLKDAANSIINTREAFERLRTMAAGDPATFRTQVQSLRDALRVAQQSKPQG